MKFSVKAGEFANALKPVLEVATKETSKEHSSAEKITLKAEKDGVIASAYGGTASIRSEISDAHIGNLSYSFSTDGEVTTNASHLMNALKSFRGSEEVELHSVSGALNIHLCDDHDVYQTINTYTDHIKLPIIATKFKDEAEVNRSVFHESFSKVDFAVAFENKMQKYMCVVFEASKNKIRLASGSGARFAVCDVEGKNITNVTKSTLIIFPKNNLGCIKSVIGGSASEKINVGYAERDSKSGASEQIVISFDGVQMCIFNIDSKIRYPNLDKIIGAKYPCHVVADNSDFKYAVKGVSVSKDISQEGLHNTDVTTVSDKEVITFETRSLAKAKRKVKFDSDESNLKGSDTPWFRVSSTYLAEVASRIGDTGSIQIAFENQEDYKDLREDDDKQPLPVLVTFPEIVNEARDTTEKLYIFFVLSTK